MLIDLFFSFLQIGLFGIGGGLVSVSLLMQQVVTERQWLTASTFNDLIAIAESTPGPLVVNSATFIGMQLGGIPGAVVATFASVLPYHPKEQKHAHTKHHRWYYKDHTIF